MVKPGGEDGVEGLEALRLQVHLQGRSDEVVEGVDGFGAYDTSVFSL
jgi:hypothetical protein